MLYVISYTDPDIDCIACSIGYAELLSKIGVEAKAVYFGKINLEVDFVKQQTNYFPVEEHVGDYGVNDQFILVDNSDPTRVDPRINTENIIEIYDHRQTEQIKMFTKAKTHIDLVGSCATLIAEEYRKNKLVPSKETSKYLYSAIASNTVNFKNSLTTDRDIKMAAWLKDAAEINDSFVREMFLAKSNITPDNLHEALRHDLAIRQVGDKKVAIVQIEMVDVKRIEGDLHQSLLEALNRLVVENKPDYFFFNGIDIIEGYNRFYTIDEISNKLFSKALDIPDLKPGYKTDAIIMRKQIFRKVEDLLLTTCF